jgi:hypothetical protein
LLLSRRKNCDNDDLSNGRNIRGVGLKLERWDTTRPSSADCGVKMLAKLGCAVTN